MPTGRPPSCLCGECSKCKERARSRARYQALTTEERKALAARRDREKVRAADRARYHRDPEKRIAAMKDYAQRNPDVVRANKDRYIEDNPEKKKAHDAVNNAVRRGKLEKGPCEREDETCRGRIEGHHDDYSKPLEVRWLCKHHHELEHHYPEGRPNGQRTIEGSRRDEGDRAALHESRQRA